MHLPKYFTTVTPFSKLIAAACFIIIPFITFYIGLQVQNSAEIERKNTELKQLKERLKENEEEIQLLILDSGKYLRQYKNTYTYADFGIYSPLFEGQEITNMVYNYKRQTITQKSLALQDKSKNSFGVNVWEYTSSKGTSNQSLENFVIFDGYENYALSPHTISDIVASWKESYTNSNGIKMYWSYGRAPKGAIYAVYLEFLHIYPPNGHPSFVRLFIPTNGYLSEADPKLQTYKEQLKRFADTISLRKR